MRPVRGILALVLAAAAAPAAFAGASPAAGAGPAHAPDLGPLPVEDTVVFNDDTLIVGRVRRVTEHEVVIVMRDRNERRGRWRFRRDRVKRIEYDVDGLRRELEGAPPARLLAFARWLEGVGLLAEARAAYRALLAAPGAPPAVLLAAARGSERLGDLAAALRFYKDYLLARPDAPDRAEVARRIERLRPRVPAEDLLAVKPEDVAAPPPEKPEAPAEGPEKPPADPEKPPEGPAEPLPKVVEGLEIQPGWQAEGWGRKAALSVIRAPGTNNRILSVQIPAGGDQDKVAVGLHQALNLAGKKSIVFNIYNGTGKPVGVAFAVTGGSGFFEARSKFLKPGWTPNVRVTLRPTSKIDLYKSEATNWRFSAKPKGLDRTRVVYFLLYHRRGKGLFYLDSVRFE